MIIWILATFQDLDFFKNYVRSIKKFDVYHEMNWATAWQNQ